MMFGISSIWQTKGKILKRRSSVFVRKIRPDGSVERYKARLVAQDFSQIPGVDYFETFGPVIRYESVRVLTAHATYNQMFVRQMDIKTAFLYGDIDYEVLMAIPKGVRAEPGRVCRLKKSIHGLKQTPRQLNKRLIDTLKKRGLIQSDADPCLFYRVDGKEIVEFYVDLYSASATKEMADDLERLMNNHFKVTCTDVPCYLLSMEMCWLSEMTTLSQETYLRKILARFSMTDCKPISTPIEEGIIEPSKLNEKRTEGEATVSEVLLAEAEAGVQEVDI
jgi:hypothetical protein